MCIFSDRVPFATSLLKVVTQCCGYLHILDYALNLVLQGLNAFTVRMGSPLAINAQIRYLHEHLERCREICKHARTIVSSGYRKANRKWLVSAICMQVSE